MARLIGRRIAVVFLEPGTVKPARAISAPRRAAWIAATIALLWSPASAQWEYGVQVVASPSGRWYAVIDGTSFTGGRGRATAHVEIAQRAAATEPAVARWFTLEQILEQPARAHAPRSDRCTAVLDLDQFPGGAWILDDGRLVCLGSYASEGRAALLSIHAPDGELLARAEPEQIFAGFSERFAAPRALDGFEWQCGSWIDLANDRLVLVAKDGEARSIDLRDGAVAKAALDDVARAALRSGDASSMISAVHALEAAEGHGCLADLEAVVRNAQLNLALRLEAAIATRPSSIAPSRALADELYSVFETAIAAGPSDLRARAWRCAGSTLGADGVELYRSMLPELARASWQNYPAIGAGLVGAGPPAVDVIVDMLLLPDVAAPGSDWLPVGALTLLEAGRATTGNWRSRAADKLPQIDSFIAWRDDRTSAALDTLLGVQLDEEGTASWSTLLLPTLVDIARRPESSVSPRLAALLQALGEHPHPSADWDARLRRATVQALQATTGRDLGDDPAAWGAVISR